MLFQTAHNPFGVSNLGDLGAPRRRRGKPSVSDGTRKKILAKYKWLRDEDVELKTAFDRKLPKQAKVVMRKLAKMRDHFRKQGMKAVTGKTTGQVAGRVALAYYTVGISELARLAMKSKISKDRKKRAEKFFKMADACDLILRYWSGKFRARVAALRIKAKKDSSFAAEFRAAAEVAGASETLEQDGAAVDLTPEPGDVSISDTVQTAVAAEGAGGDEDGEEAVGFLGLSGKEVLGYGALGILAGFML